MKQLSILLFSILLFSLTNIEVFSQVEEEELIFIVEDQPLFNDEDPSISFRKYIKEKVEISSFSPSDTGRIIIQFWIDTQGRVCDPKILDGLSESSDSLACQIILSSPKWTPAKQRGRNVKIAYTLPIYINMEYPYDVNKKP